MTQKMDVSSSCVSTANAYLLSLLTLLFISYCSPATAEYGAVLGCGLNSSMKGYRLSFQQSSCFHSYNGCIPLNGYWEGSMTHIRARFNHNNSPNITGASFIHVFRYERPSKFTITTPYLEAGIGAALYNKNQISGKKLGSSALFEVKLGAGLRFEINDCWHSDIGYKFLHNSTGYVGSNNGAINMHFIMLSLWFK